MSPIDNSFQRLFLNRLSGRFKSRSELVHEVSGILHVGRDAVYRRLRGDTALTADEMVLLAETYQVRMEIGGGADHKRGLRLPPADLELPRDEFHHIHLLYLRVQQMNRLAAASFDIASTDLPIYYQLSTPMLRSFKIFMYGLTSWNLEKWKDRAFFPQLINEEVHDIVDQLVADHFLMPAREFWSVGMFDTTLRQIRYMVQLGRFESIEDADLIYDELLQMVDYLEKMESAGKRYAIGSEANEESPALEVHYDEISGGTNIVVVRSAERSFLFSAPVSPDYLVTAEQELTGETEKWFDNLIYQNKSLREASGQYASTYFARLRHRIMGQQNSLGQRHVNIPS